MKLRSFVQSVGVVAGFLWVASTHAAFHLFQISQLFSNADGTVQYVVMTALSGGQQFIRAHTIVSSQGGIQRSYTFPTDLPGDTATGGGSVLKSFLIGTQGFAALNIVRPDYIVPDNFLFTGSALVNWAGGSDLFPHPALPTTGGQALSRNGTIAVGSPINFLGETARMPTGNVATPPMALENPQPGSFQSGIGLISGWSCEGSTITVAIDGATQRGVPYGSSRGDTTSICGASNSNTGFGLLFNYNGLGSGTHTAQVFVNGQARGNPVTFTVTAPAGEFLSGFSREITVPNFPTAGRTATLIWQEAQQNFAIKSVQ